MITTPRIITPMPTTFTGLIDSPRKYHAAKALTTYAIDSIGKAILTGTRESARIQTTT
jgi:DNA-directed RNA polymerase specialized sigma subunit